MAKGFEESLSELEEIAKKLESSDISLDESIKLFEDGMKLSKNCKKILDSAEKKVSVLLEDKDGNMEKQDFLEDEEK